MGMWLVKAAMQAPVWCSKRSALRRGSDNRTSTDMPCVPDPPSPCCRCNAAKSLARYSGERLSYPLMSASCIATLLGHCPDSAEFMSDAGQYGAAESGTTWLTSQLLLRPTLCSKVEDCRVPALAGSTWQACTDALLGSRAAAIN